MSLETAGVIAAVFAAGVVLAELVWRARARWRRPCPACEGWGELGSERIACELCRGLGTVLG